MPPSPRPALGVMLRRELPPDQLGPRARLVEELDFDEAWVVEDCFWTSGVAAAAVALAATRRVGVGIGILPAVLRNPAVAAMELATLAGAFPGRLTGGFGHGVADWMRQVGAHPDSPLAALEETLAAARDLLAGERVSRTGRHVALRDVELVFPPATPVPLLAGVTGPKGLAVAGRAGDGVILPEGSSPAFVADAAARVRAARGEGDGPPRTVVFAWLSVREDAAAACDALRPVLAAWIAGARGRPQLASCSFAAEAEELAAAGGPTPDQVPDAWVQELAVAGDAAGCAAAVARLAEGGADTVVLVPPHEDAEGELRRFAAEVLPRLGRGAGGEPALALRPLTEEDLPAIDPWFGDPETVSRLGDPGWPRRLLGHARAPGRHAVLALADGEPVALADVEEEAGTPRRAAIALVVAPARRRSGVALALLDALAAHPELRHVDELVAGIEAGHPAGLALARAAGAAPAGDDADPEGFLRWTRPLDPGGALHRNRLSS